MGFEPTERYWESSWGSCMQNIEVKVGQEIGVRCDMAPGAFSDEYLVTIETVSGPVSGFVPEKSVIQTDNAEKFVRAIVKTVETQFIGVWMGGSFFTTTGLASIPPQFIARL